MTEKVYRADFLESENIDSYLELNRKKSILRLITCGSVDDGKSTLIGRLLFDSKRIFEDQLQQLKYDSKKGGTQGDALDFALLVDGLASEREQGITIDVAYRFFTTEKRKFIVADTPGHEQYTRNMVTGASMAQLAIILIDARKGILTQTRRHCYLCHLLGIKHIVLAINKIDLIGYNQSTFRKIIREYKKFSMQVGIKNFTAIPISALNGDNILFKSKKTKWYSGLTLMEHLENVTINNFENETDPFYMPVQWVNRPNQNFRGYSGRIVSGTIKTNDKIFVFPSGKPSRVGRIVTYDGDLDIAVSGQSITLTFADEIDCSRGQIITSEKYPLEVSNQFEATIIWMDEVSLVPGRSYYLKIGTQTVSATVGEPKYKINIDNLEHIAVKTIDMNSICVANIYLDRPIPYTAYSKNRVLGGFILINKMTNSTAGAGLINFALRRAQNIHWQTMDVTRENRADLKNQNPSVIWLTGISSSGKTTIANIVEKKLNRMNRHTFLLDGDNVRHGLNKDLGFSEKDRVENIRRVGEVTKLMTDAGLIVITAFISPFRSERETVRKMMEPGEFIEVYIDTPLSIAEKRDVKGLYAKARSGSLKNFTGVDSPYEAPEKPDIYIDTLKISAEKAADKIIKFLMNR